MFDSSPMPTGQAAMPLSDVSTDDLALAGVLIGRILADRRRILIATSGTPRAAIHKVIEGVAEAHGVTVEDIMGRGLARHITTARQAAYWAVRHVFPRMSLPSIGCLFGRDHATIHHGIAAHEARMAGEGGE